MLILNIPNLEERLVNMHFKTEKNTKLVFDDLKEENQDILLKLSIKSHNLVIEVLEKIPIPAQKTIFTPYKICSNNFFSISHVFYK